MAWVAPAQAQNQLGIATSVLDAPGGTALTGDTFRYRVSYSCDLISIPDCVGAMVTVDLPPEVVFVSSFFPPSDVASGIHDGAPTGGTVTFTFQPTVPAGNTGDLDVTVRFPNGSTADGTMSTGNVDAAVSTGTGLTTQMEDLPPVTASASPLVDTSVGLDGAFIGDCPVGSTYNVTVGPSTANGSLDWLDADVVLELPAGVTNVTPLGGGVFDMMTNTVTWTGLGPISVPSSVTLSVDLSFLDPPFSAGQMVTSTVTTTVDPLGEPPGFVDGPTDFTHTLVQFVEDPDASVSKGFGDGRPSSLTPAEGQAFSYSVSISNSGNHPLDTLMVTDDGDGSGGAIDPGVNVLGITTGAYSPAPTSVTVTAFGDMGAVLSVTSVNGSTDTPLGLGGLAPGERVDRIEWVFNGGAPVGMSPSTPATVDAEVNVGFPTGTTIDNHVTADWTATLTGLCGGPVGPDAGSATDNFPFDVSGPYTYLDPQKNEFTTGPYFPGDTVTFELDITNNILADDPAAGLVVTDLLPEFLEFQGGSETFSDNGTGVSLMLFEEIPNYNGTGRTLLRWTLSGDLDPNETVNISFDTELLLGVLFGSQTNTMGVSFAGPVEQICAGSSATDSADLDGDSDDTDTLCTNSETITVAAVAQLSSVKLVQGQCNSSGPGFIPGLATDDSVRGGIVDWRVEVQNVQTVPMENFVIIDILPFVGDTGVRTTTPRLSLFRTLLVEAISPPPGGTVFYSLSGNPCRPEVGGPTSGCDAPNWSPIPPVPITDAQSIKVEFGDLVLNPLDVLEFQWRMITPSDAGLGGDEAFNSFAFGANRQDDSGFLGAEPNKVGIDVTCSPVAPDDAMLGDFVWIDTNGDGDQDMGEVGLNDVPVSLFSPGPDGMPRTGDDVLVLSSITADDDMGNPGWYKFSALSPGDYYVQFTPPVNFQVTVQGMGGAALDSDTDPVTACTDVVTLAASEVNLDVDMGLLPPVTAALGNYVWFDRDGDGVQNEALTDGLNGVAVKLFADDGDGNPEPGGDDGTPLQVAVTANDGIGNPGFYLFEDLIPGVPYFVQFMLPQTATGFTTRNAGGDDTVDSDADTGDGTSQVVTLAAGDLNLTVDAGLVLLSGDLSLGNQVWCDDDGNGVIDAAGDNDGSYDPVLPEAGINGVRVNLYLDVNTDGSPQVNEFYGSTQTLTLAGNDGRYRFDDLPAGDFIVEVASSNFVVGGPFDSCSPTGVISSTGNEPTSDPDDDVDNDDEGDPLGTSVFSQAITLTTDGEPTPDANDDLEDDDSINFTVDFGFVPGVISEFDFGDNPDVGAGSVQGNYQTVVLDGGAQHELTGPMGPFLGACVDSDTGMAQNFSATADDLAGALTVTHGVCAVAGDDEDGVSFSSGLLMIGGTVDITVGSGSPVACVANGWIDWNRDGEFDDFAPEKIFTDAVVTGAPTVFAAVPVPPTAVPGITYARFRCSTAGGESPIGPSPDGEVEDYLLQVAGADFGDAPDTYSTLLPGGAMHDTDPSDELYLGNCVDTEPDGQPNMTADADDLMLGDSRVGDCVDDEDGITFDTMLVRGMTASVTATAAIPTSGLLDAWIDFNGDGDFDHPGEHLFAGVSQALSTGSNSLPSFTVPSNAAVGLSYARFRLSTAGGLTPAGMAGDGEVEDYAVIIKGFDFGDAPDPEYPTLLASGGAQHVVDPTGSLYLGPPVNGCADVEDDGAPSVGANGDDMTATLDTSADAGLCDSADDEKGVTFNTMLFTCQQAQITVSTGAAGRLDAWIDYDRSGANGFGGVSDQIITNMALASGSNMLTFNVPCGAQLGDSYARFRFSSTGGLAPGGLAMDGEVEDYPVLIKGVDFGDAADTHSTDFPGGPTHGVTPGSSFHLGACVDTETDAQAPLDTTGDDAAAGTSTEGTCSVANDDEDGVAFTSMLVACDNAAIDVTASSAGVLDAWIDFNGDGTFAQAGERIFNGQALAAGVNNLSAPLPCDLTPGNTATRFRFSSTGVASFDGDAMDGEVEDYTVLLKGSDFGDAPDTYDTSDAAGGPSHGVDTAGGFFLGACVDTEGDASTPLDGSGDDATTGTNVAGACVGGDDEDGVTFDSMVIACQTTNLTVTASLAGLLDAWIDFDGNGDFTGGGEQIFSSNALAAGPNSRSFPVPCDADVGTTYVRFRFSSTGGLGIGGPTMDGEVEDYAVVLKGSDLGDAPDTYGTSVGTSGPLHGVDPASTLYLGACVDTESDAQAPLDGSGDDANTSGDVVGTCAGGDDEDGVSFDTMVIACQDLDLTVTSGAAGVLDGWIDFNGDGMFAGAAEQIFTSEALALGANSRTISVPCDAVAGSTYARFRLSSSGGLTPQGPTMDGEVEDYAVLVKGSDWGDAPDTYGTTQAMSGPLHGVDPNNLLALGVCVDTEVDAQAPLDSTGDDVNASASVAGTCVAGDDEDGVTFDSMVIACQQADLTVVATAAATLDAWLDFGGEGTFAQPADRIFAGQALAAGSNSLSFNVPCDAALGSTYVRFRLSSTGIATSGGPAMDGEVEDYAVTVKGSDLGDLPDTFQTSVGAGGPAHGVDPAVPLHLGACVDTETDAGLPLDASGDDVNGGTSTAGTCAVGGDDEDGVTFDTDLVACRDADITVTASAIGLLDAWVDFDGNGDFVAVSDQIFAAQGLVAGANNLTFNVPCDAVPGTSYVRFRFSSTGVSGPAGPIADGEVEDYVVTIDGVDFGDAPDTYATVFTSNGPSHGVDTAQTFFLGACVDTESDGQVVSGNATDDDANVGSSTAGTCVGGDDEDGVAFDTLITACKPASITVDASAAGLLDAWIDYDADGSFGEAGDQVFASEPLVAGPNTLNFNVPCTASSGTTFSRFRFSTAGGLSFDGEAVDGEVEDYQISSDEVDLGDAPDSYSTLFGSSGALHGLDPALDLYLGACVDSEVDGQPNVAADGDDANVGTTTFGTCVAGDDEDGVTFVTPVVACQQVDLTVVASDVGRLDAWLDLDGDGTFNGPSDHIFDDQALVAGANNLSFNAPCDSTPGDTYARFRFGANGGLDFFGTTSNGEVEDYAVQVRGADLGDAPDSYSTTFAAGGPNHGVDPAMSQYLGACVDTDANGQPSMGADGDDVNGGTSVTGTCVGIDDEDGVTFVTLPTVCLDTDLTVVAASAGILDAWLDLDGDGTFNGPSDQIFTSTPLMPGSNNLVFNVPCDATPGDSYARFRFSTSGGLPFGGPSVDGEVEDYAVLVQGFDFGDAPDPQYPTLLASDGARHVVLPMNNPTLGSSVDIEIEGLQSPDHTGDDNDAIDDEDGIEFTGLYIPNAPGQVIVESGATGGLLSAWVDFNQNGDWNDPGEQIATDLVLAPNTIQDLDLTVDAVAAIGDTCARFRLSSFPGLMPTGQANDGEVEDYTFVVTEENALLGLSKVILDVQRIDPGASYDITFLMQAENFGNININEVQVMADLADAFQDAESMTVVSVDSMELTVNPLFDGDSDINLLTGTDSLDIDESGEILLVVNVVPAGNPGPYVCSGTITGTSDADTDVTDVSNDGDPDDNGNDDPTDDDTPTVVLFDLPPIEIPTLGTWGLFLMGMLLVGFGRRRLRRR